MQYINFKTSIVEELSGVQARDAIRVFTKEDVNFVKHSSEGCLWWGEGLSDTVSLYNASIWESRDHKVPKFYSHKI